MGLFDNIATDAFKEEATKPVATPAATQKPAGDKAAKIDFSAVKAYTPVENKYESFPDGKYDVKVSMVEVKVASTGLIYFGIKYEVIDGDFTGRFIFDNEFVFKKDGGVVDFKRDRIVGKVSRIMGEEDRTKVDAALMAAAAEVQEKGLNGKALFSGEKEVLGTVTQTTRPSKNPNFPPQIEYKFETDAPAHNL